MPMIVRDAQITDAESIARIYAHYVRNTTATFELEPPEPDEMARRIGRVIAKHAWLVAQDEGKALGYAYGSSFRERAAYLHSTEVTVYVEQGHCGRGIGGTLFEALLSRLQALGYVQAIGGIALPNPASVRLHERFGFEKTAHLRCVGYKLGKWIDVGYWQKQINPLSGSGGIHKSEVRP
jgi:L-amino acid N-acyltransferase YncA